jgi:hypothetical protein
MRQTSAEAGYDRGLVTSALLEFPHDLITLLHRPRRFLGGRATGRRPDLARACLFFTVAVLLGVVVLLSGYTPQQSPVGFGLGVLVSGLMATVALSGPLWLAWRLVGATGHYAKVLIVLLHQVAVLHLTAMLTVWFVVVALDARSHDVMRQTMDAALEPGTSIGAAFETVRHRLEPLVSTDEVRLGLALGTLVSLLGAAWGVRSWGAYREALGLGRARSAIAFAVVIAIVWLIARLVGLAAV